MDESFNTRQTTPPNPPPNTNLPTVVPHDPTQPTSPYFIGSSDGSGAMLITHTLDYSNYYSWARSMKRALRIKNKLGFIDGTICEPSDPNDPLMEHWLRCNDIVITWMHNTMTVDIKSSITYAETAHQLWLELEQRFAQQNAPRIFEVKQGITNLKQDQDSVSIYFSKFKTLLDELLNYESIPNCTCGGLRVVVQNQQRDCVMKFLMGLNDTYKAIKAQILLIKPFPSLNEVYSIIQQEEKRREISTNNLGSDSIALVSKGNFGKQSAGQQRKDRYYCTFCKIPGHSLERCFKANLNKPTCAHCQMSGHTADKCYRLHGYPAGYKGQKKNRPAINLSNVNAVVGPEQGVLKEKSQISLTPEQYNQLLALLKPISSNQAFIPSSNHAMVTPSSSDTNNHKISGISLCFSIFTSKSNNVSEIPWIIDNGATNHMICSKSLFHSIQNTISSSVALPNGQIVPVTHIGTPKVTKNLILHNALCVPNFSFNLISAKKMTQELNCCLVFFFDCCYIQDLLTWTTIGIGKVKQGLYHMLQKEVSPSTLSDALSKHNLKTGFSASVSNNSESFDLWHYRLSHSSYS
ncbi:uncharacterized protein LOC131167614 [Malania oleifera]|uniref:uncharacterized protein LOC131167614 n=1 Tax=Malania oleifera TaxID=397392 RepID=UPI0025AE1EA6|nr:uncharacterized protein LOC131167614 [Malania oleifera]